MAALRQELEAYTCAYTCMKNIILYTKPSAAEASGTATISHFDFFWHSR